MGASLLAKNVNDDEGCLNVRGALTSFASKPAPTRGELTRAYLALWLEPKTCRSEPARDGLKSTAFNQQARVIVSDHREQARSYKGRVSLVR